MAGLRPLGVRLQWGRRGKRQGQACLAAGPSVPGKMLGRHVRFLGWHALGLELQGTLTLSKGGDDPDSTGRWELAGDKA